jgi:ATP-dependent Clp protease adaptor protein ClpS
MSERLIPENATMGTNRPATAKVLLLNDNETTMEFVVQVLEGIFGKTREEALKLVLEIHRDGSGECGEYNVERASDIAARVESLAERNRFPLRCIVKPSSTP